MPVLKNRFPRYRKHRSSGQAVVTIGGKEHYLGPHGTAASRRAYRALIFELQASGAVADPLPQLTVVELIARYWSAEGQTINNREALKSALRQLKDLYGDTDSSEFGPKRLKAIREQMIAADWSRKYINEQIGRIKRMFRWAVSEELVEPEVWQALAAVEGLRKHKSQARETGKVLPVSDDVVAATLPHLSAVVADMVRVQRLCGGRPQDVCNLRPCDLETDGAVWIYRPAQHKGAHREQERVLFLAAPAQEILRPYLARRPDAFCFSPREAEMQRRSARTAARKIPQHYGNRPGTNRKRRPQRSPGDRYDTTAYRKAIYRGAQKARVSRWSPNQLRHTAGTEIRRRFGLEAAQVFLGHSSANVTQIYAERDLQLGIRIAQEMAGPS